MNMSYDEARKSDERLSRILSHMDKPPATVMDFGAHLGVFSHGLARAGYDVTAVEPPNERVFDADLVSEHRQWVHTPADLPAGERSEEHTSELQSLIRISYAVFCWKKNN